MQRPEVYVVENVPGMKKFPVEVLREKNGSVRLRRQKAVPRCRL